ncbi:hypothetical protein SLS62_004953 [Diatrype stigma]|uniref:Stress-response A/B barrel domain-containing protein n=1 Tax=Diatrype stigma TaxID=117547 RepID=A0AAN9YSU4_9PEZI
MPVKHIVLFQFKADASPESVKNLMAKNEGIRRHVGAEGRMHPPDLTEAVHQVHQRGSGQFEGGHAGQSPQAVKIGFRSLSRPTRSRSAQAGIQYGFVVEFDSLEDRDYYVEKDAAHEAFKKSAGPIIEKVIVVDYSF